MRRVNCGFRFTEALSALTLLVLLVFASTCHATERTEEVAFLTFVEMEGFKLELTEREGRCSVRVNGNQESDFLGIPYPCGFVRVGKNKDVPRTFSYEGVGHVFLIAGPPTCDKTYQHSSATPEMKCSNHGQALIVNDSEITLREPEYLPAAFCHYNAPDEKDYYSYAHHYGAESED